MRLQFKCNPSAFLLKKKNLVRFCRFLGKLIGDAAPNLWLGGNDPPTPNRGSQASSGNHHPNPHPAPTFANKARKPFITTKRKGTQSGMGASGQNVGTNAGGRTAPVTHRHVSLAHDGPRPIPTDWGDPSEDNQNTTTTTGNGIVFGVLRIFFAM